jgi:hypothetical protein
MPSDWRANAKVLTRGFQRYWSSLIKGCSDRAG